MRTAKRCLKFFRQGEEEVCIASRARWNAQLRGLVELERRCRDAMQRVKLLSERQEILKGMVEDKIRLQSRATEKYYDQIFGEWESWKKRKQKRLCHLCRNGRIHGDFRMKEMKQEGCRGLESPEVDSQNLVSFESCRSLAVDHVEEMSLESLRKRQDAQEVVGQTAGKATRGRGEDAWRLEPEGETETSESRVVLDGVEGVYVDL